MSKKFSPTEFLDPETARLPAALTPDSNPSPVFGKEIGEADKSFTINLFFLSPFRNMERETNPMEPRIDYQDSGGSEKE